VEREYSINGFHQQINLVERTWSDDLRAMSYDLGIAIGVLVNLQDRASVPTSPQSFQNPSKRSGQCLGPLVLFSCFE
jgi:hypothetical protein